MNRKSISCFFSVFLICGTLCCSTAVLSLPSEILSNQVCIKINDKDGSCLGYSLPYSGHTLEEYLQALNKEFSEHDRKQIEQRKKQYLSLLRQKLQASDKQVKDELFRQLSLKFVTPENEKNSWQVAKFNTPVDWTLIIVTDKRTLSTQRASGVEEQEFSSEKHLHPSITQYENNKTVIRVYRKISTHQEL